jgi:CheY-like chemotaxis protein
MEERTMAKTILIVDDDTDFQEATAQLLTMRGYKIITAINSQDALTKAKTKKPNAILLDVMMSSKTEGFDAAKKLKADSDTSHIPVIIITGIRREMNLPFGFEADADWLPVKTVLEKPVKPETLLKAIEDILGQ